MLKILIFYKLHFLNTFSLTFLHTPPATDHLRRWSLFVLHFFQMPFFIHFLTLLLFPIYSPPSVPSYFLQPYSFLPHLTFYIPLNFLTCLPNSNLSIPLFLTLSSLFQLPFFFYFFTFTFFHHSIPLFTLNKPLIILFPINLLSTPLKLNLFLHRPL